MTPERALPQLVIEGLGVRYRGVSIVEDFNLTVGRETVVLFGPSGCGKTSIIKAVLGTRLAGMRKSGRVLVNGAELPAGSGLIRAVLQGPVVPEWIHVRELCKMGATMPPNTAPGVVESEIDRVLAAFGIQDLKDKYPSQLSGGQKQRVSLAVALLGRPRVLLLDEPTTFVDGATRLAIWEYIEQTIQPLGVPTLIVSHDPVEAIRLGDRIVKLTRGARIEDIIDIELPHPRSELIEQTAEYWSYRTRLNV